MIDQDDPVHRMRRKLVSKGFTPRRVLEQEASIREIVEVLVDAVCERGTCDLVWDIAAWVPLIVIGDALGFEPPDRTQLLAWSDDMMRMLGQKDDGSQQRGRSPPPAVHRLRPAAHRRAAGAADRRSDEHPRPR